MANSSFLEIIKGYESEPDTNTKGKRFASVAITGSVTYLSQGRAARRVSEVFSDISKLVAYTSTRAYGLFLLGFGLLTLIINLMKDYIGTQEGASLSAMVIGAVFSLIAIPLVALDKPITLALRDFTLTDFIFFEFLCIQPTHIKTGETADRIHPVIALVLGLLSAILGAALPIIYVIGTILSLVYIYLAFISPEFSFLFTFLVMPYIPLVPHSDIVLSVFVGITLISFLRKVISGKRVYFFEKYDLLLLLMLTFVLISGVFVKGMESFTSSLVMIVLSMGGYILSGCLVTNRRLADSVIRAIIVSSVPISVWAIVDFVREWLTTGLQEFGGVSATFDNPDTLAIFLLVSAVFSLYFIFVRRHTPAKLIYVTTLILTLVAMALTLRSWVAVAGVLGVLAYFALQLPRGAGLAIGAISILPYLMLFLPSSWLYQLAELPLLSAFGLEESVAVWINSRAMFLDNVFSGVGIGAESFALEYRGYATGSVTVTNSQNFLLQIACEAGVFALLTFLSIFFVRLKHRTIYVPYVKNSQVSQMARFSETALVVLIVYGLFTSLWSDLTMYYLFWCVFGIGSATLRVSKSEFDDRVGYFSDGAGADFSSIDIEIK